MDKNEFDSTVEQLKAQGMNEQEILKVFYTMFLNGDLDKQEIEQVANALGYEMTQEFKDSELPAPSEFNDDLGGAEPGDLESIKEKEPGESDKEFLDRAESVKNELTGENEPENENSENESSEPENESESENENSENSENSENESDEDDEDKDWEKAQKMFRV